ncbi:ATP-binding protein [Maridesulfovibrio sp.]|uniref:ATP-binding response regulator n=1 Tax=Maridesulfovibrio sp. TaxID=2795000 RepID=UPI0029F542D0|nr:ATP-binding protein [Maridesulfovibrio sp.]
MEKARVLIVDDMSVNIEMLSELLSTEYRVSVALNGFDAIELATSAPMPDLILLDIMMPGIDGYQVCKILKENEDSRNIPVIFVTSRSEVQSEEKGFEFGAVDYVVKPFNPAVVLARVKTHIALYNQTRLLQNLIKERTAELEKAKNEAVMANKAKSNFLANMSHELRTPLNGIMGMTQILINSNPSKENREFLEDAHQSSTHLLDMVNDLLEISNVEAGKIKLSPCDFNVRSSLKGIVAHYSNRATEKGLKLTFNIEDDFPIVLNADITRIRQVLINLLNNAIQFTEQGSIDISVSAVSDRHDTVKMYFTIADTGIGIAKDQHEKIFEPFTIGEDYMTKRYGGAGLGLSISKHIVTLMEGNLWLESSVGNKTVFSFFVPCRKAT